jgi:sigma-B regulation protein RsbQ
MFTQPGGRKPGEQWVLAQIGGIMPVVARNNVTVRGEGRRAMVFAHGFGCDQNMWRHVTPAFESDYKVVLFDHVGCGKSDLAAYEHAKYSSLAGYAADVIEIGRALDIKGGVFVAHSVSAMIGILAAVDAPDLFSELVLIGPSPRYINDEGYEVGSRENRSRNCWNSWTIITWDGPPRWAQ